MTEEKQERIQVVRAELSALVEEAQQAPPGPEARDLLRALMLRLQTLTREAEELTGEPVPAEVASMAVDIRQMLDNWDELEPLWETFRDLGTALAATPRNVETVREILERAQNLRATLDRMRELVPASYYQDVAGGFDPMIAALREALSQHQVEN